MKFNKKLLQFHVPLVLTVVLVTGFFLRLYHCQDLFYYSHDNDLAGWMVKDVVVNHHLRLAGQETSTAGIFIGMLFYYLQIPFYLLTGMDPIGATLLVAILGTFAIWSFYFVFSKIWDKTTGYIGTFIYAFSFYTILNDREVVPTMPVIVWSVWYLFALWLLVQRKQRQAWPLLGLLLGLIWHLNFALVVVTPLIVIAWWLGASHLFSDKDKNKKPFLDINGFLLGIAVFVISSLPLIVFELRHNFQQIHALVSALTTDQHDVVSGSDKVVQTFHIASKNVSNLLWGSLLDVKYELTHSAVLILFALLIFKKRIDKKFGTLMGLWLLSYFAFFSSYSKILSEYYLNGMIVIYIAIFAIACAIIIDNARWKKVGYVLLAAYILLNMFRLFTLPIDKSRYIQRKAVIAEIKKDSEKRGYPCVSISYITSPGNNLGYRYFIWLAKLKTKPISDKIPVYSIVFPLKPIFHEDISFDAIGLIYPDYSRYNNQTIQSMCEGEDWNLTESMFGYTE